MEQLTELLKHRSVVCIVLWKNDTVRLHLTDDSVMVFAGKSVEEAIKTAHEWAKGNLT